MRTRAVTATLLAAALLLLPLAAQARWMNPATGRFQTMDSYEGNTQDPPSLHRYLYCQDNPAGRIDPSGNTDYIQLSVSMGIGTTIGALSAGVAAEAQGRVVTMREVLVGASIGAVMGPLSVAFPTFAAGAGAFGFGYSAGTFAPILLDPHATYDQRVAAAAMIVSASYGANAGFRYAQAARSVRVLPGSGPEPGVIEVSVHRASVAAFKNYRPSGRGAIEFVFDPVTQRFVVGAPRGGRSGYSPHEQLAASIGADRSKVVGGMFKRSPTGEIVTNEGSGHFHQNWTAQVRANFVLFLESMTGIKVTHTEGPSW